MYNQGWVNDPKAVERIMDGLPHPEFSKVWAAGPIKDSGKGKKVLLYKYVEDILGTFNTRYQQIGDCVSMGAACAVDVVKAVQIHLGGDKSQWVAETATEPLYGFSRVEIGQRQLGRSDGSVGAWVAEAVKKYGTLARIKYPSIDLSTYNPNLAKAWGYDGVPNDLEPTAVKHTIRQVSLVTTYEQSRDSVANGYPIVICSNQGFSQQLDNEGFARAEGTCSHCMCVIAVDDEYKRPGVFIMNSWGDYFRGGTRNNQPKGGFWFDADVFERRILSAGDSWTFSNFVDYPAQELNLRLF